MNCIVLEGLRGECSIAELLRREGISNSLYYRWSKESNISIMAIKYSDEEVFCLDPKASTSTVRRRYVKKRGDEKTYWCDDQNCELHGLSPLIWNGTPIGLDVDHINGNRRNNTLNNLRLLCPNCHRQQATSAGRNIGSTVLHEDGWSHTSRQDGKSEHLVKLESGVYGSSGMDADLDQKK